MKFIKFVTLILTTCSMSFAHYDIRIDMFQNHQTFEKANPDVIFAGYPGLKYRCYVEGGKLDSSTCKGNYFQWMLNLKYDLDVAENQCNWLAKEMISKELLETIGGKYGLSEMDSRDDSKFSNEIIEFQNMAALHASIAMEQMAVQRKTTEIMKKHIKLGESDIRRAYTEIDKENDLALDHDFEEYLKQENSNSDEFQIDKIEIKNTKNNINDIRELASILNNPDILENIMKAINSSYDHLFEIRNLLGGYSMLYSIIEDPNKDREFYLKKTKEFINESFNFVGKEFLKGIAENYFIKIYDKVEHLLKYKDNSVNLKLRDCNGSDIFGNVGVCSYNALLELLRKQKENAEFVSVGGMYDFDKVKKLSGEDLVLAVPFKHFSENEDYVINNATVYGVSVKPLSKNEYLQIQSLIMQREQAVKNINCCDQRISEVINFYMIRGGYFSLYSNELKIISANHNGSEYKCAIPVDEYDKFENTIAWKDNFIKDLLYIEEEIKKFISIYEQVETNKSYDSINFIPTNDLSSRIRAQFSYIIWQTNKIRHIKSTKLLKKTISPIILKDLEKDITHKITQNFSNPGSKLKVKLQIVTEKENLTPLQLLKHRLCENKLDSMFCALGLSTSTFLNPKETEFMSYQWPLKKFFNEKTMTLKEDCFLELSLNCFHITNPFSAIVGTATCDNHARLVLQYDK